MKKLIVLESADNLGKTSVSKNLAEKFSAKLLASPSKTNSVKMIRGVVKANNDYLPFERQCLHTITHLVDFYEEFDGKTNIVMDRCHISALVYGKLQGIPLHKLKLLYDLHKVVSKKFENLYETHVITLTREKPFSMTDDSYYEKNLGWEDINQEYVGLHHSDLKAFFEKDKKTLINIGDLTVSEVSQTIYESILGVSV